MTQSEISQSTDPHAVGKRIFTATGLSVLTVVTGILVVVAVAH
ncbi:hypothetical protein [Subtercola endophyticus]|nr:hypothetical protein [Subtercola endophyticus]